MSGSGENLLLILVWRRTYHPLFSSATFVTYFHAFSAAYPDQIDLAFIIIDPYCPLVIRFHNFSSLFLTFSIK